MNEKTEYRPKNKGNFAGDNGELNRKKTQSRGLIRKIKENRRNFTKHLQW